MMHRLLSIFMASILSIGAIAQERADTTAIHSAVAHQAVDSDDMSQDYELGEGNIFKIAIYRLKTADWPSIAVSFASSCVIENGIDYALKKTVHEMRPNRHDNHSFPSRHSSTAYSWGCTISYFLVPYSPWWGIGCHVLANGMGFQRVMSGNHYPGDVMGGAAVGIGSDMMGTVISNWIFGSDPIYKRWYSNSNAFSNSVLVTTCVSAPLQETYGDYLLGTALTSTVRGIFPLSNAWGISASYTLSAAPLKHQRDYVGSLNSMHWAIGGAWHHNFSNGPFALNAFAETGYRLTLRCADVPITKNAPLMQLGINGTVMLTKNYSVGAEAGYSVTRSGIDGVNRTLSGLNFGFLTRASF